MGLTGAGHPRTRSTDCIGEKLWCFQNGQNMTLFNDFYISGIFQKNLSFLFKVQPNCTCCHDQRANNKHYNQCALGMLKSAAIVVTVHLDVIIWQTQQLCNI
jgi:hypothetical protein